MFKTFLLCNLACIIWIIYIYIVISFLFYLLFGYIEIIWHIYIYLHLLRLIFIYIHMDLFIYTCPGYTFFLMRQYLCILSPPIYLATPTTATYRVCIRVHPDDLTIEGMLRWCREFPPSVDRRFFHGHPPEGWNGADNLGWTNWGVS